MDKKSALRLQEKTYRRLQKEREDAANAEALRNQDPAVAFIMADIEQTLREAHGKFEHVCDESFYVGKGIGMIDAMRYLALARVTEARLDMYERAFNARCLL